MRTLLISHLRPPAPTLMPRKFFQRLMPDPAKIKDNKSLSIFGERLHEPNLWHLNRRSIAGAFAVGLFFAWVPLPSQMIMAAAAAIFFRTNLPLSVVLVWITNPVTIPPMFYFAYLLGTWMLGTPPSEFEFALSMDWLLNEMQSSWKPFLTGCATLAVASSLLGYFGVQGLWRYSIHKRRQAKKKPEQSLSGNNNPNHSERKP